MVDCLRYALAGALVLVLATASTAGAAPKTHTVIVEGMRFIPEALTVQRGDRVTWVNKDLFPHTATATGGTFDSRNIAPNASWTYVARASGRHAYLCSLHTTMTGVLTVQ